MKHQIILLLILSLVACEPSDTRTSTKAEPPQNRYQADWESLKKHENHYFNNYL